VLKYESLESAVDGTFWEKLSQNKMDLYKLDDASVPVQGFYKPGGFLITNKNQRLAIPGRISVSAESFGSARDPGRLSAVGVLKNTNTLGEFKEMDKNAFLKAAGQKVSSIDVDF
jgi:ubiquitin-like modifier-activating enzyme ATG7